MRTLLIFKELFRTIFESCGLFKIQFLNSEKMGRQQTSRAHAFTQKDFICNFGALAEGWRNQSRLLPPIGPASARSWNRFERHSPIGFWTTIGAVTSSGQDLVSFCQQNLLTLGHNLGIPLPLWAPRDNVWAGAPSGSRIFQPPQFDSGDSIYPSHLFVKYLWHFILFSFSYYTISFKLSHYFGI